MEMAARNRRAFFLVIDGPDGSGKTTQARLLVRALRRKGYRAVHLREPGSTSVGEKIRRILLDPANHKLSVRSELLLYMASRAQLVEQTIRPALKEGKTVVCERFVSASLAYQGHGAGLPLDDIRKIGDFVTGRTRPDLTILLDIQPEEGLGRRSKFAASRGNPPWLPSPRGLDRLERRGLEFHFRVRDGFRKLARREPKRYAVVSTNAPIREVHGRILRILRERLGVDV